MFSARLRLIKARAARRGLKWAEQGPKQIYAQEHKLYYYYYHFGGHWENKNWKKGQNRSEQSRERLQVEGQVEWLLFSHWKYTIHQATLAKHYKILPFESSKFVKDMKGKFDKAYL